MFTGEVMKIPAVYLVFVTRRENLDVHLPLGCDVRLVSRMESLVGDILRALT